LALLKETDKDFWHGYIDFYEIFFKNREIKSIAEVGIYLGNSVRWLLKRFPGARIYGADILEKQPQWPDDPSFFFTRLDQGDNVALREFFKEKELDLIIEDGSHRPEHQVLTLKEGIKALNPGGLYILEDIHTSHPEYSRKKRLWPKQKRGNALSVLLAIDHYKRLGATIDSTKARLIANKSIVTEEEVILLDQNIASISLYRRTRLPKSCWKCRSSDYLYSVYKCRCGEPIFRDADSMSFVIEKSSSNA